MSLKDLGKERILNEMVRTITSKDKVNVRFCAMVTDRTALRVLSSCCKVYDLLEDGVTVVEMLAKQRQSLPELEVIYFLTPTEDSIMRMCEDYAVERRPKYKRCHIFFTTSLPQENDLLVKIARATSLIPRIRSFVELNLGFVAYEKWVFHLDLPGIGPRLFLDAAGDDGKTSSPVTPAEYITMIDRLVTLFTILGGRPLIKYHSKSRYSRLCENFAQYVHARLSQMGTKPTTSQPIELIIIDRSYDIGSVLAHENTYQAFVYDNFEVPVCSDHNRIDRPEPTTGGPGGLGPDLTTKANAAEQDDVWSYNVVEKNKSQVRKSILSDEDYIWRKYKHTQLQFVGAGLNEDMKKFVETNSAANMQKKGPGRTENDDAIRAMRDLPQCTEALRCFDMHLQINERINKIIPSQALNRLWPLEDEIITGVDANGKVVNCEKLLQDQVSGILEDPTIKREYNKLRLILLYLMYTKNVSDDIVNYFYKLKDFSPKTKHILNTFMNLGFQGGDEARTNGLEFLQKNKESKKKSDELKHIYADNKEKLERYKRLAKTTPNNRRSPDIKELLEDCVYDRNMVESFVVIQDAECTNVRPTGVLHEAQTDSTLRAKNQVWDWAGAGTQNQERQIRDDDSDQISRDNRKIVLFIIGGVMMSEMRSAQEVAKETKIDIYIGSTAIYTPKSFLDAVSLASDPNSVPTIPAQGATLQDRGSKVRPEDIV